MRHRSPYLELRGENSSLIRPSFLIIPPLILREEAVVYEYRDLTGRVIGISSPSIGVHQAVFDEAAFVTMALPHRHLGSTRCRPTTAGVREQNHGNGRRQATVPSSGVIVGITTDAGAILARIRDPTIVIASLLSTGATIGFTPRTTPTHCFHFSVRVTFVIRVGAATVATSPATVAF